MFSKIRRNVAETLFPNQTKKKAADKAAADKAAADQIVANKLVTKYEGKDIPWNDSTWKEFMQNEGYMEVSVNDFKDKKESPTGDVFEVNTNEKTVTNLGEFLNKDDSFYFSNRTIDREVFSALLYFVKNQNLWPSRIENNLYTNGFLGKENRDKPIQQIMQENGYTKILEKNQFDNNPEGIYIHIDPVYRKVAYLGKLKTSSPEKLVFETGYEYTFNKTPEKLKQSEIYVKNEETPSSGGKRRRHKKSRKQSRHRRRRGCKQTRRRHAKRNELNL